MKAGFVIDREKPFCNPPNHLLWKGSPVLSQLRAALAISFGERHCSLIGDIGLLLHKAWRLGFISRSKTSVIRLTLQRKWPPSFLIQQHVPHPCQG